MYQSDITSTAQLPSPALWPRRRARRASQLALIVLLLSLSLTVLEGAARKWLIGSTFGFAGYLAYFSKDILFAMLLLVPRGRQFSQPLATFHRWLVPGCFLLICGIVTSSLEGISGGGAFLTLRAALILPVLAYLVIPRLRHLPLWSVVLILGLFAMANFALSVVQNQLPPAHILNRYATNATDIASSPTGVRATGTFSYITGLAVFSVVGVWAGMVGMSLARSVRQQIFSAAAALAGLACGLASVSRGPILTALVMLAIWLPLARIWSRRKMRIAVAAILLLAGALASDLTTTFFQLGQGLFLRAESANDTVNERTWAQFDEALDALALAPFGNGLGTEQVGRSAYSVGSLSSTTFESQLPRIILELGVIGLAGFVIVSLGALAALQAAKRRCAGANDRAVILATQLFLIASFFSNIIFNHVASAFAWIIFTAVMAALPEKS